MLQATRLTSTLRAAVLPLGILLVSAAVLKGAESAAPHPQRALAQQILEATGVQGGLIVHLGCADGRLTAALRASGSAEHRTLFFRP